MNMDGFEGGEVITGFQLGEVIDDSPSFLLAVHNQKISKRLAKGKEFCGIHTRIPFSESQQL